MGEIRYCPMCGAYIPHDADKCLACGYSENAGEKTENNEYYAPWLRMSSATAYSAPTMPFVDMDLPVHKGLVRVGKTDIDLDSILSKQYFSVKLGGSVFSCYIGKADMELGTTIYHSKEMFGKISLYEPGKKKIHLTMIER